MILSALSGFLLLAALAASLFNIVMTVGLGAVGIFKRSDLPIGLLVPTEPRAPSGPPGKAGTLVGP